MSENENPADEISEEQLETVTGGVNNLPPTTYLKIQFEDILMSCVPGPELAPEKKKI